MRTILYSVLFALLAIALPSLSQTSPSFGCSAPVYRQFDFWLGDWDTFDVGSSTPDARVRVTSILGGCVVHEDYQALSGHRGESFTIYDATRKVWHQTWVTNRGELLVIEGTFASGAVMLRGVDHTSTGAPRLVRGTWKPVPGGVRETAFRSLDDGKTWQPWFDLIFRPHRG